MKINLTQINNQARQLREQATGLRGAQSSLRSFQRNLNTHWRGAEMSPLNRVMEDYIKRFAAIASDLDSIAADIVREAEAIRRAEELAAAQAALRAAD